MKNFKSQFEVICEETLSTYQQGGFLRGDYVLLKKNTLSCEALKQISEPMKEIIKTAIKNKTRFRISYIKSGAPEAFSGPVDAPNIPSKTMWADVVIEYAPGMWKDPMTLPLSVLEKMDIEGNNIAPPIPDEIKRSNDKDDTKEETDSVRAKQTKSEDETRKLPTKNTKLKESFQMLRENDSIYEAYKPLEEGIMDTVRSVGQNVKEGFDLSAIVDSPEKLANYISDVKAESSEKAKALFDKLLNGGYGDQLEAAVKFQSEIDNVMDNAPEDIPNEGAPEETTPDATSETGRFDDVESKPRSTADYMN